MKKPVRYFAIMAAILALFASATAPTHADPSQDGPPQQGPKTDGGFEIDPTDPDLVIGAALPDDTLWEQPAFPASAAGCTYDMTQRRTTDPAETDERIVYVYLRPSNADVDLRWDVPRFCPDGQIIGSPLHMTYSQMAIFQAKETNVSTYSSTQYRRRYDPARHTYINPHLPTSTKSFPEIVYVESTGPTSWWNCWDPETKLNKVKQALESRGLNDPNFKYVTILHAKQLDCDGTLTESKHKTAGLAWRSGGYPWQNYSYSLIWLWGGGSTYYRAAYGCANLIGDMIPAHELTHNLNAPHIGNDRADLMYDPAENNGETRTANKFATGTGGVKMHYDRGSSDYRGAVLSQAWDVDATAYIDNAFRLC